jgi:hypothetical protein
LYAWAAITPQVNIKKHTNIVATQERDDNILLLLFLAKFQHIKTGRPIITRPMKIMKPETDLTPASEPKVDARVVL